MARNRKPSNLNRANNRMVFFEKYKLVAIILTNKLHNHQSDNYFLILSTNNHKFAGSNQPVQGEISKKKVSHNRTAHFRPQCRKTTVLSCHRCLIKTGIKKGGTFKFSLEL